MPFKDKEQFKTYMRDYRKKHSQNAYMREYRQRRKHEQQEKDRRLMELQARQVQEITAAFTQHSPLPEDPRDKENQELKQMLNDRNSEIAYLRETLLYQKQFLMQPVTQRSEVRLSLKSQKRLASGKEA